MKSKKDLWTLFSTVFIVSATTFGGGYVIVPILQKKFVQQLGWFPEDEMLDMTALAQSSPGPIAVNVSILIGYRRMGLLGAAVAALGTILPPFLIISLLSLGYEAVRQSGLVAALLRGMRAGVAAVIVDVTWNMGAKVVKKKSWLDIVLMLAAFVASYVLEVNVFLIIIVCGLIGYLRGVINLKKKGGDAA